MTYLFTSESVTEGHPDKVCDQISDAILDAALEQDANSRVAAETVASGDTIHVVGEIRSAAVLDVESIVRGTLRKIGYTAQFNLDPDAVKVNVALIQQSPDIANGVDYSLEARDGDEDILDQLGAGDQGLMFGYATAETEQLIALPALLSSLLAQRIAKVRHEGIVSGLGPDAKTQVTVEYEEQGGKPSRIHTVLVSSQHVEELTQDEIYDSILTHVIEPVMGEYAPSLWDASTARILINPSGRFVLGGPAADAGLTGRKIIVDTYGGAAPHGGGAFCVDGETEYLSSPGVWTPISQYDMGLVGQWDEGELTFVEPIVFTKAPAKNLYHFYTPYTIDMMLSENHDMVYRTSKKNLGKKKVKDVLEAHLRTKQGWKGEIPAYFTFEPNSQIKLTDDEIRLQVAFCADGTLGKKTPRIQIKKSYKQSRLEELLIATRTSYTVGSNGHDGFMRFMFIPPVANKSLFEVFAGASKSQLEVIVNEVFLWDGNVDKRVFRTTNKNDADFIQWAFMTVYGTSSSILVDDRRGEEYGSLGQYKRKSIAYSVYAKRNKYVGLAASPGREKPTITSVNPESLPLDPQTAPHKLMYCFMVPSGMLLLRRNNRVFVTGNSGKDPSKVDRSGAYAARWVAKSIVASGLATKALVQVAYAIGTAHPISVDVQVEESPLTHSEWVVIVSEVFDLRPAAIIRDLDLLKPQYAATAAYGHFGRCDTLFPWEDVSSKVDEIRAAAERVTRP